MAHRTAPFTDGPRGSPVPAPPNDAERTARLAPAAEMAQSHAAAIARIRKSTAETRDLLSGAMDVDVDASGTEARLERTVRELHARVNEQQAVLDHVRGHHQAAKANLLILQSCAALRRSVSSRQPTRLPTHGRS